MEKGKKLTLGGQAVIEGVMIKSVDYYSVAVRNPKNKISVKSERIDSIFTNNLFKKPFIRGIFQLAETLVIGIKTLAYSASESSGEQDEEKISFKEIFFTMFFAFGFAMLLFVLLPLYLSKLLTSSNGIIFNLIDGIIRIIIFFVYLLLISRMNDIKTIFQYHGAEHKAVHCYEHNLPLTVKNVRKYPTLHPRCGTSFIMIVLIFSILIFSLVSSSNFWIKFLSRVILIPIIAGISYEFLKFFAKYEHNKFIKIFLYPGLFVQKITTKEPTDKQIEVAIKAVESVLNMERKRKYS